MTGDATITLDKRTNVLVIPLRYIKETGNDEFVNLKDGSGYKSVQIETGDEIDGNIEVKSGLKEGDVIYELSP
jgi:multidrug efflux pump subunit AcrA (membrane-fusion protein)